MSNLIGTWNLRLKTPVGTLAVRYRFDETEDGVRGAAVSASETVPLENITTTATDDGGERVSWRQKVTKPMRLNLDFEVAVSGNTMTGHSRAGRLPRTTVTGERAES
jgi:hypothetical protein